MLTAASAADERTREIRNKFIKYLAALAVSFEHKIPERLTVPDYHTGVLYEVE